MIEHYIKIPEHCNVLKPRDIYKWEKKDEDLSEQTQVYIFLY